MYRKILNAPEHLSSWNNKIRISYWMFSVMTFLAVLGALSVVAIYEPNRLELFVQKQVILRNVLVFATLLAAETVYRLKSRLQSYIIITLGSCFAAITLALSSPDVHGVHIVMILPILVAILYFDYWKIAFACINAITSYMLVILFVPVYRFQVDFYQKAVGFSFVIIVTLAALGIVNRGLRIIRDEKEALTNENKHRLEELAIQEASRVDALTGLDNHNAFQSRFRAVLADESVHSVYLAIVDIDNFKRVNDTYGHSVGNMVLRKIGKLLKECSEENISPSRYGGEEFTIIFSNVTNKQVSDCLEHLRAGAEQMSFPELEGRVVTISIGCHRLESGEDRDTLFRLADEALYLAKRSGKNRVSW
ncbi:hypothetical protein BK133_26230 [Paenibacillus sp. FSL H8-0548]|uniref:GGDEF domain-containing protein n=1 Tax=Paenibacillus sp. FSL H8-0548 TaxID=1920422 RepID=UPI00096DB36A|nr:GGDEF domain-containing protein [Paenibacillus sp. FSL H8-0548]OMF22537.1 hypothetical protein BK133_26230 [Paenibacillus sp. FSL H8-0548]